MRDISTYEKTNSKIQETKSHSNLYLVSCILQFLHTLPDHSFIVVTTEKEVHHSHQNPFFRIITARMRTLYVCIAGILLGMTSPAHAFSLISPSVSSCNFVSGEVNALCVLEFIAHVIQQIFQLTGGICLIVVMIGGYELALGQAVGGKEKGQTRIRYGVIGLFVSATSFFIVDFIVSAIAGI